MEYLDKEDIAYMHGSTYDKETNLEVTFKDQEFASSFLEKSQRNINLRDLEIQPLALRSISSVTFII